jgi:hypothetical protein
MARTPQETMMLLRKMRVLCVPTLQRVDERLDEMRELLTEKKQKRKKDDTEGENRMEEGGVDRSE